MPAVFRRKLCAPSSLPDFPMPPERRTLLFLGRIHPKKGLDRILNCLRSLQQAIPNVLLVIAGDGEAHYTRHLRQLVSALALDDYVLFAGRLDGELKWACFRCSRALPAPLPAGKFRNHSRGGDADGCARHHYRQSQYLAVCEGGRAGLVLDERDINALLPHAIEELLKDDATRLRMGVQGSRYARERLTWHASAQKLLACYNQVLSSANTDNNCNGS